MAPGMTPAAPAAHNASNRRLLERSKSAKSAGSLLTAKSAGSLLASPRSPAGTPAGEDPGSALAANMEGLYSTHM
eukprot:2001315-Prymnesium_polylepis.1